MLKKFIVKEFNFTWFILLVFTSNDFSGTYIVLSDWVVTYKLSKTKTIISDLYKNRD
jgi:hypothetical protein